MMIMKDEIRFSKEVVIAYLFDDLILFPREREKNHDKPVNKARSLART
jgi:hypothetical protein